MQKSVNSCGLAALAFVAHSLGLKGIDEQELTSIAAHFYPHANGLPPLSGYSLADIMRLARHIHLQPSAWRGDLLALRQAPKPLVLWVDQSTAAHFIVLTAFSDAGIEIFDPRSGRQSIDLAALKSRWLAKGSKGIFMQFRPLSSEHALSH